MASFLEKFGRGAAEAGASYFGASMLEEMKSKYQSIRDTALEEMRGKAEKRKEGFMITERVVGQEFKKTERIAGEAFKAQQQTERLAAAGDFAKRYKVVGSQLFDAVESERQGKEVWVPVPEKATDIRKLAAKMTKDSIGDFPDAPEGLSEKEFYDQTFNDYVEMLGGAGPAKDRWEDFIPKSMEELRDAIRGGLPQADAQKWFDKMGVAPVEGEVAIGVTAAPDVTGEPEPVASIEELLADPNADVGALERASATKLSEITRLSAQMEGGTPFKKIRELIGETAQEARVSRSRRSLQTRLKQLDALTRAMGEI